MRKNCSSDREKLLKFEAEGREFAKCLRSLEQFIQTVKGRSKFFNVKLLKFGAEGREFAKCLRWLEQFIQTVKGQNNFW